MTIKHQIAISAAFIAVGGLPWGHSLAADRDNVRPSLSALVRVLNGGDRVCQMHAEFARRYPPPLPIAQKRESVEQANECVKQARDQAGPLYKQAIADEDRPEARQAIKTMYIKWVTYVDGISGYEPVDRDAQRAFAEARVTAYMDAELDSKPQQQEQPQQISSDSLCESQYSLLAQSKRCKK